jgi:hypothetical protein
MRLRNVLQEHRFRPEISVIAEQARKRRQRHGVKSKGAMARRHTRPVNVHRLRVRLQSSSHTRPTWTPDSTPRRVKAENRTDARRVESTAFRFCYYILRFAWQRDAAQTVAGDPIAVKTTTLVRRTVRGPRAQHSVVALHEHRASRTAQSPDARKTTVFLGVCALDHEAAPSAFPKSKPLLQHEPGKTGAVQTENYPPCPVWHHRQAVDDSVATRAHRVAQAEILPPKKLTHQTAQLLAGREHTALGVRRHDSVSTAQGEMPLYRFLDGQNQPAHLVAPARLPLAHSLHDSVHKSVPTEIAMVGAPRRILKHGANSVKDSFFVLSLMRFRQRSIVKVAMPVSTLPRSKSGPSSDARSSPWRPTCQRVRVIQERLRFRASLFTINIFCNRTNFGRAVEC